ncbi:hypothetical protein PR202_gb23170 [Eleusine coracana subsp. coracana]|uniref:Pentatricopeptide repeat-containing protein n=1 Tax=Eleusine coracana subsp. coracana TaxID=191504 RepID=A0AAV5FI70_ELECO|nr:hypothetical protein PR202_gb23170 [Eleusine coracana subsp. coracana]
MRASHLAPALLNGHTYTFLVTACAGAAGYDAGQALHALAVRAGLDAGVFVCDALVAFYAKCGDVAAARKAFDGIAEKDVVTEICTYAAVASSFSTLLQPPIPASSDRRFSTLLQPPILASSHGRAICSSGIIARPPSPAYLFSRRVRFVLPTGALLLV